MHSTLVSCPQLAASLGDAGWLVYDCRNDLFDREAGRRAYAAGHIPGARHVHLEEVLSGPITGRTGRHPLPDPQLFCERMRAAGLSADRQVVAYDGAGGVMASRLWWMLRWLGHEAVAVLDGGWNAWVSANSPVSTQVPASVPGDFRGSPQPWTVDAACLQASLGAPDVVVVDARAADRFRGENETLDPVGGHIPGAANYFFQQNLTAEKTFKSPDDLKTQWSAVIKGHDSKDVVVYCGSGVTACHNLLALEHAGIHGVKIYPGSWSEWSSDPSRPRATEPE